MGIALTWVAVESLPVDEALARLGLAATGEPCRFPFSGLGSHPLTPGWLLVQSGRCGHRIGREPAMAAVSAGCRAVACAVEEHVNFASSELWQDGQLRWRVTHAGDRDAEHLSAEGSLPPRLHQLLAGVEGRDSENLDGYFHMDIPLMLAQELTGCRHDLVHPQLEATPFDALRELRPARPWWRFW